MNTSSTDDRTARLAADPDFQIDQVIDVPDAAATITTMIGRSERPHLWIDRADEAMTMDAARQLARTLVQLADHYDGQSDGTDTSAAH